MSLDCIFQGEYLKDDYSLELAKIMMEMFGEQKYGKYVEIVGPIFAEIYSGCDEIIVPTKIFPEIMKRILMRMDDYGIK